MGRQAKMRGLISMHPWARCMGKNIDVELSDLKSLTRVRTSMRSEHYVVVSEFQMAIILSGYVNRCLPRLIVCERYGYTWLVDSTSGYDCKNSWQASHRRMGTWMPHDAVSTTFSKEVEGRSLLVNSGSCGDNYRLNKTNSRGLRVEISIRHCTIALRRSDWLPLTSGIGHAVKDIVRCRIPNNCLLDLKKPRWFVLHCPHHCRNDCLSLILAPVGPGWLWLLVYDGR